MSNGKCLSTAGGNYRASQQHGEQQERRGWLQTLLLRRAGTITDQHRHRHRPFTCSGRISALLLPHAAHDVLHGRRRVTLHLDSRDGAPLLLQLVQRPRHAKQAAAVAIGCQLLWRQGGDGRLVSGKAGSSKLTATARADRQPLQYKQAGRQASRHAGRQPP